MDEDHDIPFLDWLGARLVEWTPEQVVLKLAVEPHHLNRSGVVHGGIYSVLADAAGGLAGCYSADPQTPVKSYTLSLTTSFLGATGTGELVARGLLRRRGRRVYFSTVEITGHDDELVALAEGSFLYRGSADSVHSARLRPHGA